MKILNSSAIADFQHNIVQWHHQQGRKDLPWQLDKTPYRVWVSEIMLQQTQVKTVIPYYLKFMTSFPSISDLANASEDDVLHHWTGLGYYARARNLHKSAKFIVENYAGNFPNDIEQVIQLPGIGRSTAGAILSLSLEQPHAIVDGNVKRVLSRYFTINGHSSSASVNQLLWQYSEQLTPQHSTAIYNQAMMDLGATICTRSKPNCQNCPIQTNCLAKQTNSQTDYPQKKPKKSIPVRTTIMVIPQINHQVLMEKRPPAGIWGGLWCFHEISNETALTTLLAKLQLTAISKQSLPSFRHTFSHFHLDIQPLLVHCKPRHCEQINENNNNKWYDLQHQSKVGLAASTKQLLTLIASTTEE